MVLSRVLVWVWSNLTYKIWKKIMFSAIFRQLLMYLSIWKKNQDQIFKTYDKLSLSYRMIVSIFILLRKLNPATAENQIPKAFTEETNLNQSIKLGI